MKNLNTVEFKEKKRQIFNQVVNSNIEMLKNTINNNAFDFSSSNFDNQLTEEEIRIKAVDFFYQQIAKYNYEHLTNKLR